MLGDRLSFRLLPPEGTGRNRGTGRDRKGVRTRCVGDRMSRGSKHTLKARRLECTWSGFRTGLRFWLSWAGASFRAAKLQPAMRSACGETRVWLLCKSNPCRQSHLMQKPHHCGVSHRECPWHLDVSRGNCRSSEYPTLGPRTNWSTFANSRRTVKQKYARQRFHSLSPCCLTLFSRQARPRMEPVMHRLQALLVHMRVNLRRRDVRVTQQLLNNPQVRTVP